MLVLIVIEDAGVSGDPHVSEGGGLTDVPVEGLDLEILDAPPEGVERARFRTLAGPDLDGVEGRLGPLDACAREAQDALVVADPNDAFVRPGVDEDGAPLGAELAVSLGVAGLRPRRRRRDDGNVGTALQPLRVCFA